MAGRSSDVVRERLLTPVGLRSLAPGHPDYKPPTDGDLRARDAAYHQGTVWAWLIGPFVDAWLKVHPDDRDGARAMLGGLVAHLDEADIGSISEVFDAEAPFIPRGCVAQAWSVAEVAPDLAQDGVITGPDAARLRSSARIWSRGARWKPADGRSTPAEGSSASSIGPGSSSSGGASTAAPNEPNGSEGWAGVGWGFSAASRSTLRNSRSRPEQPSLGRRLVASGQRRLLRRVE